MAKAGVNPLRAASAALAVAGLISAIGLPYLFAGNSGADKARLTVFDRADGGWEHGWRSVQVRLSRDDNPVRIRVEAEFQRGAQWRQKSTGLAVVVARNGQVVTEGNFELPLPEPSQGDGNRASPGSSIVTPEFRVDGPGLYTVTVRSDEAADMSFSGAVAVVRTGYAAPDWRYAAPGLVALAGGAVLFFFANPMTGRPKRRRRKNRRRR